MGGLYKLCIQLRPTACESDWFHSTLEPIAGVFLGFSRFAFRKCNLCATTPRGFDVSDDSIRAGLMGVAFLATGAAMLYSLADDIALGV